MIKELKLFIYLLVIFFFFFLIIKYYFSDDYEKKLYRKISILDKDLASYSDKIILLDNDTNNIVKYVDNDKSNVKKNYHFWDLLKKNDK
tara:strand:- start:688 stop:954 length:267 start_codon:yes stop_codon:yes gene_type:complete